MRVTPPLVSEAVIVVVPAATPVTSPEAFTVAAAGFAETNVGAPRPAIAAPF